MALLSLTQVSATSKMTGINTDSWETKVGEFNKSQFPMNAILHGKEYDPHAIKEKKTAKARLVRSVSLLFKPKTDNNK